MFTKYDLLVTSKQENIVESLLKKRKTVDNKELAIRSRKEADLEFDKNFVRIIPPGVNYVRVSREFNLPFLVLVQAHLGQVTRVTKTRCLSS